MRASRWLFVVLALGCTEGGDADRAFILTPCPDDGTCFDAAPDGGEVDGVVPDRALPPDQAVPDAAVPDAAVPDAAVADAGLPDAAPPEPDAAAPIEGCADIDSTECFGHPDCGEGQICLDVGPDGLPVPCCVPGEPGDLPAGASCADVDGQRACASGVCIEGDGGAALCSTPCQGPDDCPPALPRCVAFPFGGTAFDWCFPP